MSEAEIRDFFARLRAAVVSEQEPTEAELKAFIAQALAIAEIVVVKIASAK